MPPFTANGKSYAAGSFVIKTAQPYGPFANTMLARQDYPDLRIFPGGPPEPPYDVTGQTLWMLTGVQVDSIAKPFDASLELVKQVTPMTAPVASTPACPTTLPRPPPSARSSSCPKSPC